MTSSDLVAALRPVADAFHAIGVPYYLTGSVASSAHGVARTSVDADIVAALEPRHVDSFIERRAYLRRSAEPLGVADLLERAFAAAGTQPSG